jgi:hypothetical protein
MSFLEKSLSFRSKFRELLLGWFNPEKLNAERTRAKVSKTLQNHWGADDIQVFELIRENWEEKRSAGELQSEDGRQYAVFIDSELDVDWITKGELPANISHAITRADAVGGTHSKHLPREQRLEFKRIVAHSIVAAIRGGLEESRELTQKAEGFLKERTIERSRTWTLCFSHLAVLLLATVLVLLFFRFGSFAKPDVTAVITGLMLATSGGLLGAYLSIIQKAGRGEWDAAAGKLAHVIEVATKLVAGIVLGGIAFAITQSTHAPGPIAATAPDHYSTFLFGFAAGFFERLIPKIVSSYPNKLQHGHNEA